MLSSSHLGRANSEPHAAVVRALTVRALHPPVGSRATCPWTWQPRLPEIPDGASDEQGETARASSPAEPSGPFVTAVQHLGA